eukprot:TRINITY_DN31695_c0_g1_i2.p1 TRINITY_DN31695_c0_g1~~TRINITY_DN31695_c0_g1_i2.p1  ORF type:complete len:479 (-),score=44.41 TRINITY_DN31695_c0_g1_i2:252-1688(-)
MVAVRALLYALCTRVLVSLRVGDVGDPTGPDSWEPVRTSKQPCLRVEGEVHELTHPDGHKVNVTFKCRAVLLKTDGSFNAETAVGSPLLARHIAQMAVMQRSAAASSGTPQTIRELADKGYLTASPIMVYALEEDGDLIGSVLYKNPLQASDKRTGKPLCRVAEAGGLAVHDNYQVLGVAKVMTTLISTIAYDLGYTAIYTETKVANYKSMRTQLVPYKAMMHGFREYADSPFKIMRNLAGQYAGLSTVVGYVQTNKDLPNFTDYHEDDRGPTVYRGTIFGLLVSPTGVTGVSTIRRGLTTEVNDACEHAAWEDMLSNPNYEEVPNFTEKELYEQFRDVRFLSYNSSDSSAAKAFEDMKERLPFNPRKLEMGKYKYDRMQYAAVVKDFENYNHRLDMEKEASTRELVKAMRRKLGIRFDWGDDTDGPDDDADVVPGGLQRSLTAVKMSIGQNAKMVKQFPFKMRGQPMQPKGDVDDEP